MWGVGFQRQGEMIDVQTSRTRSSNLRTLSGTMRTLVGATSAGRESTWIDGHGTDTRACVRQRLVRNGPHELTHTTVDVLFSAPEAVFQQCVQDAAQTKRRLDDVWCKLADWGRQGQMTYPRADALR